MTIAVNNEIGNQSVQRTLQLHAQGRPLPPHPEGHPAGGEYSESETENPLGSERWLWYTPPGGEAQLLGKVPPRQGAR